MKNIATRFKHISATQTKVLVSIVLMISLGMGAAFSVSALSHKYFITDGDNVLEVATLYSDAEKVLEKAGVLLDSNDRYDIDDSDPECTKIIIRRSQRVELTVAGEKKDLTTNAGTVKEFLEENGVTLNVDDVVSVNLDEKIFTGMNINVDRVEVKETKEEVSVPFKVTTQKTKKLNKGETKTKTAGENGVKEVTTVGKYVNGVLAEVISTSENVVKPAKNQVDLVGTRTKSVQTTAKPASKSQVDTGSEGAGTFVDKNGSTVKYKKVLRGQCTAYTAKKGEGSATGRPLKYGNVAVDPRKIPYGSRLYICSPDGSVVYGHAVASDTGGAMRSGRVLIDLYYNSEAECNRFGRRNMVVYVLE